MKCNRTRNSTNTAVLTIFTQPFIEAFNELDTRQLVEGNHRHGAKTPRSCIYRLAAFCFTSGHRCHRRLPRHCHRIITKSSHRTSLLHRGLPQLVLYVTAVLSSRTVHPLTCHKLLRDVLKHQKLYFWLSCSC